MDELPADILARIADDARPAVLRWWAALAVAEREDVRAAWDEEQRAAFFAPDLEGEPVPVVIGGRFVPVEESALVGSEWHADYFEYLLKYPELFLDEEPSTHICTAHPEARAALAAGRIPAEFTCPLGLAECPMRLVLARKSNQALQLTRPTLRVLSLSHVPQSDR